MCVCVSQTHGSGKSFGPSPDDLEWDWLHRFSLLVELRVHGKRKCVRSWAKAVGSLSKLLCCFGFAALVACVHIERVVCFLRGCLCV